MIRRVKSRQPLPAPSFTAGVLAEPMLSFGAGQEHIDPKVGLSLYGPFCPPELSRPALTSMTVGMIGPPAMLADTQEWVQRMRTLVVNDGSQPWLYPHFPGVRADAAPFYCDLVLSSQWCETIKDAELNRALAQGIFEHRVTSVLELYLAALETLSQREPLPNVVLILLPQDVVDKCGAMKPGERPSAVQPVVRVRPASPQLALPFGQDEEEDTAVTHRNFRRGLKARAMRYGIPTQIVWPRTIGGLTNRRGKSQDPATRAWNLATALYHKAGGVPWRLHNVDPGVCFVGVSFYRESAAAGALLRTSMAQTFTASGGYVLRGNTFDWDEAAEGKSPHLDHASAQSLIREVLDLYKRQNKNSLPSGLVVHKRSRFWPDELDGFQDGAAQVPQTDFVAMGERGIRFFRPGDYPPLRGTYVKFSDANFILYATGYIPFLESYPGARIPQPLEIVEHFGDSPWTTVLHELLGLTKLNWNSADFAARSPITLAFSHRVGEILAELPDNAPIRHEYRFYM
jgi:hypothetical protein